MIHDPKFIFFGTPRFAELVLKELLDANLLPGAVICNPDRPVGRKKTITKPAVKRLIIEKEFENKIKILQPENSQEILTILSGISKPDIAIVAAYSKILPADIINLPKLGTLGVHPSLLPKYRGASPIQSVILSGEKETGVTIYKLDEKMDHGPILAQEKQTLNGDETYLDLEEKLAILGGKLLVKTIQDYTSGNFELKEQDHKNATFTKKISTDDAFIDESDLMSAQNGENAEEIYRKIRGFNPEPGAWTIKNGKRTKLLEAKIIDKKLVLTLIQEEGKNPQKPL
ncbi:MAG: methionyl-tRNA formyltransferase [Candidatus Harrisonbacteria bacterium CG10_big_fil_rev_8_21_14_0_10_40_38]|uniref:Methionyl-tRNA formyltransferase n=1 Tax=Candidatus Harrisonbacteria bacterium CG10_big_fil_rev_8_21_14_0_10_40_38 TaxID=1974583 RepID=A0A2H0USP3_9BACT|nr:MAG: methionyl-tRNA formyltransferase [Candidatus Harrisonbacteria bacterium CG10_big_fil_rev_8_21_14_0_10_40_38]